MNELQINDFMKIFIQKEKLKVARAKAQELYRRDPAFNVPIHSTWECIDASHHFLEVAKEYEKILAQAGNKY